MRRRPGLFLRWFFRVPPALYQALHRIGRADGMRRRMLLLTTRGRRTGRPRTCGLNYAVLGDTVYVMSGFGRTDWIRNLEADPRVEVCLGQDRWSAQARVVTDPDERRRALRAGRMQAESQGPPDAIKPLLRRIGFDYNAELRKLDDPSIDLPTVAITHRIAAVAAG